MLGIERRQQIMVKLRTEQKVYVSQLAKEFNVTEETIRRDLEKLEEQNMLVRSYGGAVLPDQTSEDIAFNQRSVTNIEEKKILVAKAANLIKDGDSIFLDSSTTALAMRSVLECKKNITLITNSIRLLYDAASNTNMKIISTGGRIKKDAFALVGPAAISTIQNYHTDLAIISCKALNMEFGSMESNDEESIIKQYMLSNAKKIILLVDHHKFNKTGFVNCSKITNFTYVVTDQKPSQKWIDFFEANNVVLIYAE